MCKTFEEKKAVNKKQNPGDKENEKDAAFHNYLSYL